MPRRNRFLVYLGACFIAGIRLARERQVHPRVIPTSNAIDESVDLAYELFHRVFRYVPRRMPESEIYSDQSNLSPFSDKPRTGS